MQTILLNGKTYTLRPDKDGRTIRRTLLPQFAGSFRPEGRRTITSISYRDEYTFGVPGRDGGFGRNRITNVNDPAQFKDVWDSTADTRSDSGICLPPLKQTATNPTPGASGTFRAVKSMVDHAGVAFLFNFQNNLTADSVFRSYTYSGGSWNNNEVDALTFIGSTANGTPLNAIVHKGNRFACFARLRTVYVVSAVAGAASAYTDRTATATWGVTPLADNVTQDENIDAGLLHDFGNTLLLAVWNESSGTISIYESTDLGATWAASLTTAIGSGNGPQGWATYYDDTGTERPILATREGLYSIDLTNNAADLLVPLNGDTNNGRGMRAENGVLWVPLGSGGMMRLDWTGAVLTKTYIGPNALDGLPTERQGYGTASAGADRWICLGYGGAAAATKASIFAVNVVSGKWSHLAQEGTANRKIDAVMVSNGVLHHAVRTGTNTSVLYYQNSVAEDPVANTTMAREASGYIQPPEFDGGFPGDNASWEDYAVNSNNLTATADATSGKWVAFTYSPDGGSFVNTDLSDSGGTGATNFLSGQKTLYWGLAKGKSAVTMQPKLTLNRGTTNTLNPIIRECVIGFKKRRVVKYRYEFDLDVDLCARRAGSYSLLDTELLALLPDTQIVKVALAYGIKAGSLGTRMVSKNVYVEDVRYRESVESDVPDGTIRVMVSEA